MTTLPASGNDELESLRRRFRDAVATYGFGITMFGREAGASWRPLLSHGAAEVFETYFKTGVGAHDPVYAVAASRRGLCDWRAYLAADARVAEPFVFRVWAASMGLRSGFSASFIGTGYRLDVISVLSCTEIELDVASQRRLLSVISEFWHAYNDWECRAEQPQRVKLTARELNVLQWMKEGKSYGDIATITGLTPRAIEFHSRNVLQKLDAADKTTAVLKAIRQGLIGL